MEEKNLRERAPPSCCLVYVMCLGGGEEDARKPPLAHVALPYRVGARKIAWACLGLRNHAGWGNAGKR